MHRIIRITVFLFLTVAFACPAYSQWWRDPFGNAPNKYKEQDLRKPPSAEDEINARLIYEDALEQFQDGNLSDAKKKFRDVARGMPRTEAAPDSLVKLAEILRRQKRYNKAFKTAQQVIGRYPDYPKFNEVIRTQFEIATAVLEGNKGKFLKVIPRFRDNSRSRRYFEVVIRNAPFSDYAAMSLMNIAMVSDEINEEEYAIDALDRLINFYPDSIFGPDAYYLIGDIFASMVDGPYYDQGSTEEAISYYEDFLLLFPDNPRAENAEDGLRDMYEVLAQSKYLLGEFYYLFRNNTTAALVYYNETITVAPNSEAAVSANKRIERIKDGKPPPRTGLGIAQLWNSLQKKDDYRDAELIRREEEELDESEKSKVIPAPPSPQG